MFFWHVGMTILIFRYVFRDERVDLRFLALGAVLPDVIDKPIGTVLFADTFRSSRIFAHTLVFAALVMTAVLLISRRGPRRRQWMALGVGVLLHLVLDGMWTSAETLLWPFLGWEFPPGPEDYWGGLLGRIFDSPWVLVQEAIGLTYLAYLWRAAELADPARRRQLVETGRITTAPVTIL